MSTLPRLLRALSAEPLVIERRTLDAFLSVLRRRAIAGESFNGLALHAELDIDEPRPATETETGDRTVAVIPIVGVIANRVQSLGAGTDEIGERLARAVQSRKVDAIVLDVDSPGGTITGVPELAEKVFQARKVKPVVAVANGLMASAAYWIGAAAEEVVASPSSSVGSIGVFMIHEDLSGLLEKEGVVVTEFSAGRFKTEGAPWKPLTEDARAFFETRVAEVYDWFVRDVARFRGDSQANVRAGYGEGRVLAADAAVTAGLADRVGTLEETIARFAKGASPRRGARAESVNDAEVLRRKRARSRGA